MPLFDKFSEGGLLALVRFADVFVCKSGKMFAKTEKNRNFASQNNGSVAQLDRATAF